jgi:hypothetical protein
MWSKKRARLARCEQPRPVPGPLLRAGCSGNERESGRAQQEIETILVSLKVRQHQRSASRERLLRQLSQLMDARSAP